MLNEEEKIYQKYINDYDLDNIYDYRKCLSFEFYKVRYYFIRLIILICDELRITKLVNWINKKLEDTGKK